MGDDDFVYLSNCFLKAIVSSVCALREIIPGKNGKGK